MLPEDELDPRVVRTILFVSSVGGVVLGVLISLLVLFGVAVGVLSLMQWLTLLGGKE